MKKLLSILAFLMGAVVVGVVSLPGPASATLIYQQHGLEKVVYDTRTDLYWIQDLTAFTNQTYQQQLQNIQTNYAAKDYFGIDNWHMANAEFATLYGYGLRVGEDRDMLSELHAFNYTLFQPEQDMYVFTWCGRVDSPYTVAGLAHHAGTLVLGESLSSPSSIAGYNWYYEPVEDMAGSYLGAWVVGSKTPAPVPEPCTALLMGLGLAAARLFSGMKRARA